MLIIGMSLFPFYSVCMGGLLFIYMEKMGEKQWAKAL